MDRRNFLKLLGVTSSTALVTSCGVDKANEKLIPSIIIHPLVENAIKYGMKTSKLPLKINLNAVLNNNTLKISVQNSGNWYMKENIGRKSLGLKNVAKRLKLADTKNNMEIHKESNTVTVTLNIY